MKYRNVKHIETPGSSPPMYLEIKVIIIGTAASETVSMHVPNHFNIIVNS